MHLQLLHTVEIFLAVLTRESLFRLPFGSPASPQGWNRFCLLQDMVAVTLDIGSHGALEQAIYVNESTDVCWRQIFSRFIFSAPGRHRSLGERQRKVESRESFRTTSQNRFCTCTTRDVHE